MKNIFMLSSLALFSSAYALDSTKYTLTEGDSGNFSISKYVSSTDIDGNTSYSKVNYNLIVNNIIIDEDGEDYIYYAWKIDETTGNRSLITISDLNDADFYVQYDNSTNTILSSKSGSGDNYSWSFDADNKLILSVNTVSTIL